MSSAKKRGRKEMEEHAPPKSPTQEEPTLLHRLRNMWEFANLAQYIILYGKAIKIDEDMSIEELETECMRPNSPALAGLGLALLKFISSHRGLTPEIFDEYTRRQYLAKAPRRNPFGHGEAAVGFAEMDIFTKIRVLQQLTQWTLIHPERIRERLGEDAKDDKQQSLWRIEPFGWDSQDRTYIVLDDDRLYRRTDAPPPSPPAPKPKKNSRKAKANARANKRRKLSETVEEEQEDVEEAVIVDDQGVEDDGLGGAKWECLAVGLSELNAFLATLEKTRDPNEKILRKRLTDDLLPLLAKREETRHRKEAQKKRELATLEKLATAKRSSRIAGKMELQKQAEEAREAERRKKSEFLMAKKEQKKWETMEKERDSRMQTREQRLREREARRILHEEELSQLSEDSRKVEAGETRTSGRRVEAKIEQTKKVLEEINDKDEDDWVFDCICGSYGQKFDDGTHSISCEDCNIWQHSKCVGVSQTEADKDDFHFICSTCKRRVEDAEKSKLHPIKIKLGHHSSSSSTTGPANGAESDMQAQPSNGAHTSSRVLGSSPQTLRTSEAASPHGSGTNEHQNPQTTSNGLNGFSREAIPLLGPENAHMRTEASPTKNSPAPGETLLSSPRPHSPISLPPPVQTKVHSLVDGHPSQFHHTNGTSSITNAAPPKVPGPTSFGLGSPYHFKSQDPQQNGSKPSDRRPSASFASALAGAPVLTPKTTATTDNVPSTPVLSQFKLSMGPRPYASQLPPSSPSKHSSPLPSSHAQSFQVSDQANNLPPPCTGLSPTKHSPPRPTGTQEATPSSLPPIAPLLPSSPVQNLTPPVKSSDPDHARQLHLSFIQ